MRTKLSLILILSATLGVLGFVAPTLQAQEPNEEAPRSVFLPVDSSASASAPSVEVAPSDTVKTMDQALSEEQIRQLFERKQYGKAIAAYEYLLGQTENPRADLYYNLGCCYYKAGEIAPAILMFERAYRLDPNDKDIRINLEMSRLRTLDKIANDETVFATFWRKLCYTFSMKTLIVVGIICFIIVLAGLLLFLLGGNRPLRRGGFYAAWVGLFFCILFNLAAHRRKVDWEDDSYCILMTAQANVKSSPEEHGTTLFVLHEGTRVRITDTAIDGWYPIRLADGKEGWLPAATLNRIYLKD